MPISNIAALLVCGTWLYVTGHKREGLVMYVIAAALFLWMFLAAGIKPLP